MRIDNHRQAKSWVIRHLIKSKYEKVGQTYRPKDIIEDLQRDYGVNISYRRASVRAYGEALKLANPGTIFEVEVEDEQYFKYVFMALGSCIKGFLNCSHLVIVVDGTHLHEKYKDGENDASWTWFMTHLKASIRDVPNLMIISDCHISIVKAVASIFPDAFHALCIYHIRNNLVDKFKNKETIPHFYLAAKTYRMFEFQMYWAKLHQYPGVTAYLEEIGLNQWARVYQVHCRYDKMTTNIIECLNGVLKDARKLLITKLLEHIQEWLQGGSISDVHMQ
ncbi:uncharacterized protein LOC120090557 [Benincasa hispida]|uniref:uncharacterized protein LOC120090557 n=1 Tax=Benincasa hispida TaxID=102211 RepID=UPI001900650C|nr:uncharacterized protein LOC120090557 [Benincasa hispida]